MYLARHDAKEVCECFGGGLDTFELRIVSRSGNKEWRLALGEGVLKDGEEGLHLTLSSNVRPFGLY
jgi:hypothetical protein